MNFINPTIEGNLSNVPSEITNAVKERNNTSIV
jgi:hypothetical protein